jgi:hypothetical protein
VLFDERSQRIAQSLAGGGNREFTPAHEDRRCLACHSMIDAEPRDSHIHVVSDGVGCESCHGPAEGWLAVHATGKLSPATKQRLGMWDTDRLLTRTEICVRCHVAAPGRDVNHDLIAAGHPRLQFEMGAYHEALPKHWDDAADRARVGADFDALLWALGQACGSQAAVSQLANRAERGASWPEFAEWSCAACHHDLRDDQARQRQLADADALAGRRIAWDTWNHHMTRGYAADVSRAFGVRGDEASGIETSLGSIDDLMRGLNPNRRQVAAQARGASRQLGRWAASLENSRLDRRRLDGLSAVLLSRQTQRPLSDWSAAAQVYDALASLHETRLNHAGSAGKVSGTFSAAEKVPDTVDAATLDAALTRAIHQLYVELVARQRSPARSQFDPARVQARLVELARLLPAEGVGP